MGVSCGFLAPDGTGKPLSAFLAGLAPGHQQHQPRATTGLWGRYRTMFADMVRTQARLRCRCAMGISTKTCSYAKPRISKRLIANQRKKPRRARRRRILATTNTSLASLDCPSRAKPSAYIFTLSSHRNSHGYGCTIRVRYGYGFHPYMMDISRPPKGRVNIRSIYTHHRTTAAGPPH